MKQFLEQLLAGTQAGEDDRDVALGHLAGEPDHLLGEITIFTGSPMSSTKISPPLAEHRRLQHSWHASGIVMK